jgi:hypothetical protein
VTAQPRRGNTLSGTIGHMTHNPGGVLVEADSRGRVSLARLGTLHSRYLAAVADDGTITLTPAMVVTAAELDAARQAARQAEG